MEFQLKLLFLSSF